MYQDLLLKKVSWGELKLHLSLFGFVFFNNFFAYFKRVGLISRISINASEVKPTFDQILKAT